jgi:glycosyltransferase involved in cell wall biosynthesis
MITVITLTRHRPAKLRRAIESVAAQACEVPFEHLVLIDECHETLRQLESTHRESSRLRWEWVPRTDQACSIPTRLAQLRNGGVCSARSEWIAFLDDDNAFEPDHLGSLFRRAQEGAWRAVHSHRSIFNEDGTPFVEAWSPWHEDREGGRLAYADFCQKGVMTPGSNIVRDRIDLATDPEPIRMVDMSAWLIARELLLEMPFRETYTDADRLHRVVEDDKLILDLLERGEPIGCTHSASLRYYLGGYTNDFTHRAWFLGDAQPAGLPPPG